MTHRDLTATSGSLNQPHFIAELAPRFRGALAVHLLALSPADRRLRFAQSASDEVIRRYVARIDFDRDTVLGAIDPAGGVVGVGHLAATSAGHAELGISVDESVRGRGLGFKLLQRAIVHARINDVQELLLVYLPENVALRKLAARAGMRLEVREDERCAWLHLPPPADDRWLETMAGELSATLELAVRRAIARAQDQITSA
jgi:RimJ/RimL family protein N-acetyltransferase